VCLRGIVGEIGVLTGWVILVVRIASRIAQPCDVHRLGWGALDRCDPPRVCRTGRQKSVKFKIQYASVTVQKFCRMVPKRSLCMPTVNRKRLLVCASAASDCGLWSCVVLMTCGLISMQQTWITGRHMRWRKSLIMVK
jgi:hypothetical protein